MKSSTILRTITGSIFIFISIPQVFSQIKDSSYSMTVPSTNYIPSVQNWSFLKYGGSPVDLYTGTARVDIPIYTYVDPDFTIPISVGFASNGFIPYRHTGVVGLNWFLSVGGVITREIRGIDDFKAPIKDGVGPISGFLVGNPSKYSDIDLLNFNIGFNQLGFYYMIPGGNGYETESDIFHFNFMGHSGTFHYNGQKEMKIYNTNGNNGIYSISFGNGSGYNDKCITITTGDGYKYIFGDINAGGSSAGESQYYEQQINGYITHRMSSDYNYNIQENVHIISWMLYQIVAPNNRTVTFCYETGGIPASPMTTANNNGSIIVTEMQDVAGYMPETYMDFEKMQYNEQAHLIQTNRRISVIKTTYLSKIEISSGAVINFSYSMKDTKEISQETITANDVHNPYSKFIQQTKKLNNIITTYNGNTLSQCNFYYRTKDLRTILDSVYVWGTGTYKLKYYEDYPYPDLQSSALDFWGYYNGRDDNQYYSVAPVHSDSNNDEIVDNDCKNPNAAYSVIGNLKRIIYPTGGYTDFEYEGHTASKGVFKIYSSIPWSGGGGVARTPVVDDGVEIADIVHYLAKLYDTRLPVGGVRIKRITDYDGIGGFTSREYDYSVNNIYSDGTLLFFPRYYISSNADFGFKLIYPTIISFPANTFDKSHIEYRAVREILVDGSSVEYRYNNYVTDPDEYDGQKDLNNTYISDDRINGFRPDGVDFQTYQEFVNNFYRNPNSHHLERGKLIKKLYFNAEGLCVKKEEYEYARSDNGFSASIAPSGQKFWSSKTYTGDYRMTLTKSVEYFRNGNSVDSLVNVTNLGYNSNGQVNSIVDTLADNTVRIKRIDYDNTSLYWREYKTNIWRVINSIILNGNEYVISTENMNHAFFGKLYKPHQYYRRDVSAPILMADYLLDHKYNNDGYGTSVQEGEFLELENNSIIYDIKYIKYDTLGRLLETVDRNGVHTSYVWGYGGLYVVAIVKNAKYDDVKGVMNATSQPQISSNNAPLEDSISDSQSISLHQMPSAEVTTLKYRPFVGVTEIVEPSRRKLTYTYTTTGKLLAIKDGDGNIINEYSYSVE